MSVSVEHLAGPMTRYGVQRCRRCETVLLDYSNSMVPEGTPPMGGFAEGAVFVTGHATTLGPIGDDAVPCQGPYHEHDCGRCGTRWVHGYGGCARRGQPSADCPACAPGKFV